jgi:hypothetical protein
MPPSARGRRRPELSAELEASAARAAQERAQQQQQPEPDPEPQPLPEPEMETRSEFLSEGYEADGVYLLDGDIIFGKRTSEVRLAGGDHYFSWGVMSRLQEGEPVENGFMRVRVLVNDGTRDLAADAEEDILAEAERRRELERRRPIRVQH